MTLVKMYTILPLFLLTLTLPTQAERFTVTVRTVSFVSSNMIKPLIFIPNGKDDTVVLSTDDNAGVLLLSDSSNGIDRYVSISPNGKEYADLYLEYNGVTSKQHKIIASNMVNIKIIGTLPKEYSHIKELNYDIKIVY